MEFAYSFGNGFKGIPLEMKWFKGIPLVMKCLKGTAYHLRASGKRYTLKWKVPTF